MASRNKEAHRKYMKGYHARNKGRRIASDLRTKYGMSPEDYNKLHAAQKGLCAICARPETAKLGSAKPSRLNVDHNHDTSAVRELLCSRCNTGLGCFGDDILRLEAAVAYLRKHGGGNIG